MGTISNSKQIAKNTMLLYIRMFVLMALNLYISRVVLQYLGVEDFGLYGIVGSVVVLFSFLNSTLSGSTSRFLSYSIGRGSDIEVRNIFNASVNLHLVLILIIVLLSESIGLYVVNNVLEIPANRMNAANWTFQFTILTFCANIIRLPYNAAIISYERMNFYAYLSITDVIVKLGMLYLLFLIGYDHLVAYSAMIFIQTAIISYFYYLYCNKNIPTTQYKISKWKQYKYKEILSFSGWTLFSGIANVGSNTAINMLLNVFCGLAVNAGVSIANQVSQALYSFVSNFQTAFKPSLVKLYAVGDYDKCFKLVFQSSKFSFYLFWILTLPVMVAIDAILEIWLGIVPDKAAVFTNLIIIYLLIDALFLPLWELINATGNIKTHQIVTGLLILANFPLSWLLLYIGLDGESVWYGRIAINIAANIFRLCYMIKLLKFPSFSFITKICGRVFFISAITLVLDFFLYNILPKEIFILCLFFVFSFLTSIIIIYTLGVNSAERAFIKETLLSRIRK